MFFFFEKVKYVLVILLVLKRKWVIVDCDVSGFDYSQQTAFEI